MEIPAMMQGVQIRAHTWCLLAYSRAIGPKPIFEKTFVENIFPWLITFDSAKIFKKNSDLGSPHERECALSRPVFRTTSISSKRESKLINLDFRNSKICIFFWLKKTCQNLHFWTLQAKAILPIFSMAFHGHSITTFQTTYRKDG